MDITKFFSKKPVAAAAKPAADAVEPGVGASAKAKRKAEDDVASASAGGAAAAAEAAEVKKKALPSANGHTPVPPVRQKVDPASFFAMGSSAGKPMTSPSAKSEQSAAPPPKAPVAEPKAAPSEPERVKRHRDDDENAGQADGAAAAKRPEHTAGTSKQKGPSDKRPTPPPARAALDASSSPAGDGSSPAGDGSSPIAPLSADFAPPPPSKWYPGKKDIAPPNKGNKRVPMAAPRCLAGLTFVITGTLLRPPLMAPDCHPHQLDGL